MSLLGNEVIKVTLRDYSGTKTTEWITFKSLNIFTKNI